MSLVDEVKRQHHWDDEEDFGDNDCEDTPQLPEEFDTSIDVHYKRNNHSGHCAYMFPDEKNNLPVAEPNPVANLIDKIVNFFPSPSKFDPNTAGGLSKWLNYTPEFLGGVPEDLENHPDHGHLVPRSDTDAARRREEERLRREAELLAAQKAAEAAAKRLAEEEAAKRRAEEEARRKAAAAAEAERLRREQEARDATEREARRRAEEAARLAADEEARRKAALEDAAASQLRAEEAARAKAELDAMLAKLPLIQFEQNKATLRDTSFQALDSIVSILQQFDVEMTVEGQSPNPKCKDLANNRAHACVDYFKSKGVDASRLTAKGSAGPGLKMCVLFTPR